MAASAVATPTSSANLSRKKNTKSLRNQKNFKKKTTKNVLLNPYNAKWPVVDASAVADILQELVRVFKELNMYHPKSKGRNDSSKQDEFYDRLTDVQKEARKQVIFGMNAVTRGVEKNELDLVLVCRDTEPRLLTDHLLPLCATRNCPAAAIPDLASTLSPVLNIKSVIAVGFKKSLTDRLEPFKETVSLIQERCPRIHVPWLNSDTGDVEEMPDTSKQYEHAANTEVSENNDNITGTPKTGGCKEQMSDGTTHSLKSESATVKIEKSETSTEEDYSYLYIYKTDKITGFDSKEDFIPVTMSGDDESDEDREMINEKQLPSFRNGKSDKGQKRKRMEKWENSNKKKNINKSTKLEKCNVKKLMSNPNRKQDKCKKKS